jgi:hypothetical protein
MGQMSSGAQFTLGVDGLQESLAVLTKAGANVRGLETGAVYFANSALRAAAGQLAVDVSRTTIAPLVLAGPAPQSRAMAQTIRHKVDRMVVIRIGATNPPLSGFKSGKAGNRRWRTSLAWGIEKGPGPGRPNRYRITRREGGHVIGPNLTLIEARTVPRYRELVRIALETAGVTSWKRAV